MALQKDITLPSGVTASYWMIDTLKVQKKKRKATFIITGYKSQSVRSSNPRSGILDTRTVTIKGEAFTTWYADVVIDKKKRTYEAAYEYIKTYKGSPFEGATNIIETA